MVEIIFLGTGNAFCPSGRLHSLVLIDGNMLVDTPPTVIPQLRQHGISPAEITDLFITHWHGDHTFGLPFLLLERKWISDRQAEKRLKIHAHAGGEARLTHLCELAYPESLGDLSWVSHHTVLTLQQNLTAIVLRRMVSFSCIVVIRVLVKTSSGSPLKPTS